MVSVAPRLLAFATYFGATSLVPAAIVVFDLDPDHLTQAGGLSVLEIRDTDLLAGTFSTDTGSLDFGITNASPAALIQPGTTLAALDVHGHVRQFAAGSVISADLFSASLANGVPLFFDADMTPPGLRYAGLQMQEGANVWHGWLEFQAVLTASPSVNDIIFTRFAFNTVPGESAIAGQLHAVPEPSTYGILAGLVGLSAIAVRRRSRQRAPAKAKSASMADPA